ncbi:hypothetical protein CTEN210_04668 [Chaetoceros tenuissimus]|uniref:Uncharacterized protein n=1 Tax=Chaetoceros tenuissimus TaxID=426638 RepID=A0AAD3CLC5_9STRA|nr:hypothetical protein CTEN210_04668 [Chaetoceros tenuissimus]
MATSLDQIRESLATLESYKLPDWYKQILAENEKSSNGNSTDIHSQPLLDPQTTQRYQQARSKYLKAAINARIIHHLKSIHYGEDPSRPAIDLPSPITQEEKQELEEKIHSAKESLAKSIHSVKSSYESVAYKYQLLTQKRAQLQQIVKQMEENGQVVTLDSMEDQMDENDSLLTKTEVDAQNERIESLMREKSEMEAKLRKIRMESQVVQGEVERKKELLVELMGDEQKSDGRISPQSIVEWMESADVDAINEEAEQLKQQAQEYRDISDYYESTKSAIEVISGIKILSITDAQPNDSEDVVMESPTKTSSRKKMDASPSKSDSSLPDGSIMLKVQLLEQHIIDITLANTASNNRMASVSAANGSIDMFRVVSANLVTSSTLSDTLEDEEERQRNSLPTVSITIPPLNDLVALAANLEPVQDLKFLLRESLARIRTLSSRLNELALLRTKYLTKITDPTKNKIKYGYGGEDQEIFCSLKSQITAVLRLSADCPILKGSVYIQRLVGCGGWSESVLQKIKNKVNDQRFHSPVDLMDFLVEEIDRVVEKDGVKMPKTPVLLQRKKDRA